MKLNLGTWILLTGLSLPAFGLAQEVTWTVQTNRGWIGISVVYTTAWVEGDETTVVVIDEVADESPADAAGILVGDTLTHLDGRAISREVLAGIQRSLEAGDLVRLRILRDGRPREFLVEAAPQPRDHWVFSPDAGQVVIRLDSVRGAILQNLDSLRLSIAGLKVDSAGEYSIRVLRPPQGAHEREALLDLTYRIQGPGGDSLHLTAPGVMVFEPDVAVPFAAFVTTSRETREIREQLKVVRSQLTEARREEMARERELRASVQGSAEEAMRRDPRMQEIREREAALVQEVNRLNAQLETVSESEMRRQFAEIQAQQEERLAAARRAQVEATERSRGQRDEVAREQERALVREYEIRRPLNYFITGQSFVAGAQLQTLNSDLASYFQVEEGLLVTEVLDSTPAAEAGLLAGDVIVRVGGARVASLEDLRFGVGYLERPLRLQIVRKGSPVEVVIR